MLVAEAVEEDVHGCVDGQEEVRDAEEVVHPHRPSRLGLPDLRRHVPGNFLQNNESKL